MIDIIEDFYENDELFDKISTAEKGLIREKNYKLFILYYVLSSIQFKYKILTNKIRLDCGTVLRSGRFLTHRHVSC